MRCIWQVTESNINKQFYSAFRSCGRALHANASACGATDERWDGVVDNAKS